MKRERLHRLPGRHRDRPPTRRVRPDGTAACLHRRRDRRRSRRRVLGPRLRPHDRRQPHPLHPPARPARPARGSPGRRPGHGHRRAPPTTSPPAPPPRCSAPCTAPCSSASRNSPSPATTTPRSPPPSPQKPTKPSICWNPHSPTTPPAGPRTTRPLPRDARERAKTCSAARRTAGAAIVLRRSSRRIPHKAKGTAPLIDGSTPCLSTPCPGRGRCRAGRPRRRPIMRESRPQARGSTVGACVW